MLLIKNRKATRNFEVIETLLAGIVLRGYEVKAAREKKVNFEGSYITIDQGEAFVVNLQISRYSHQSQEVNTQNQVRRRKLLITKKEIYKLEKHIMQKGKTIIPLALLLKHNMIKLELGLVKGRKDYEIKSVEKSKQIKKDLELYNKSLLQY